MGGRERRREAKSLAIYIVAISTKHTAALKAVTLMLVQTMEWDRQGERGWWCEKGRKANR